MIFLQGQPQTLETLAVAHTPRLHGTSNFKTAPVRRLFHGDRKKEGRLSLERAVLPPSSVATRLRAVVQVRKRPGCAPQ